MKKKLLLVVFMLVCLVNTCFASNGSALDDEEQIANKVFTALTSKGEYSELVPYLSKGFAQTFTEEKFKEVKGKVNTELGNLKNFKLLSFFKHANKPRLAFGLSGIFGQRRKIRC